MCPSLSRRFALLLAGLGLSAALAAAGPPPEDKDKGTPKSTPPAKTRKVDPMPPAKSGKPDPMPPSTPSRPATILPKDDPKPPPLPKLEPKPMPLPKVEPKLPPLPSKLEPKPLPPAAKPDPKPPVDLPPVIKPSPPKVTPLPSGPIIPTAPDAKLPAKPISRPIVIHEKPKGTDPVDKPAGPGLKLPAGTRVDRDELARMKPPVDLTKTKPETVLAQKPPADFKVKPIPLDQIQVPKNAVTMKQLNVTNVTTNQTFVVNNNYYTGGNYHLKYGTRIAGGLYCYPGKWHSHWHHCIWDPCFQCHYFYCPSTCCYYYWCATDYCYYPCHWFVDYGTCYYPWWICGGFGGYGYVGTPHVSIFIGW